MTTLSEPQPEDAAPRGRRWIHWLLIAVVVLMLVDVVVGALVHWASGRATMLPVLACFLLLSGIRLLAVAVDTAQRVRASGVPTAHGWGWVVYKTIGGILAIGFAAYLLLFGDPARLERLFG